jgi:hypothetical protein
MRYLPALMIVLALLDGALHFSIDAFVNKTFTNLPYGPLFVALPIGYLVLIALLLWTRSASPGARQLIAVAFAVYAVIPLIAYFYLTGGRYNPFQLATIAKPIEVVLIVAALVYAVSVGRQRTTGRLAPQP